MTLIKKEDLEFIVKIILIILAIPTSVIIGVYWTQTFPLGSGVQILPVQIIYEDNQNNYNGELARTSADKMFEGGIIHVIFYNLTFNQTYYISMSQVGRIKQFNQTEEITIILRAEEDNWCFLGGIYGKQNYRDIVWIWIGEIEI